MKTYYASADQDEAYSYGNYDHIRTPGGDDDRIPSRPQQHSFSQPLANLQPDMAPLYSNQQAPQIGHGYSDPINDNLQSSRSNAQKFGAFIHADNSYAPKPEAQTKTSYAEPMTKEDIQRLIAGNSPVNPYMASSNDRMYEPGFSESIIKKEKPQNHYMNVSPYNAPNTHQSHPGYQISPAVNEDNYTYGQQYSPELNKPNQNFFNDQHTSTQPNTQKFTIPITSLQNFNHNQLIANIAAQQAQQGYNPQSVLTPESVHAQHYANRSQDIGAAQEYAYHSQDHGDYPQVSQDIGAAQEYAYHSQDHGNYPQVFVDNSAEAKKSFRRPSQIENNQNHIDQQQQQHNQNYVHPPPPHQEIHRDSKGEKQFGVVETQVLEDTLEYEDFFDPEDGNDKDLVGAYYQDLADQPRHEADVTGRVANIPNKGLREEYNMNINGSSIRVYSQGLESQRQSQRGVEPAAQVNHPQAVGQAAWNELQNVDKGNRNNVAPLQTSQQQKNSAIKNNGNNQKCQADQNDENEEMERIRRELAQAEERLEGLINQNLKKLDQDNAGKKIVSAKPEETRRGDEIDQHSQHNHTGLVPGEIWVLNVPDSHRKENITAQVPKKASKVLTRLNKVNLIGYLFDKYDSQQ